MIQHIALIPDGNRRWAKKRGMPSFFGHRAGAKAVEKILQKSLELQIPYFTLWAASMDNITKRSPEEVSFLFSLFGEYFTSLITRPEITENEIQVKVLGRWREVLPQNAKDAIEAVVEKTKNYSKHNLTVLLGYSGVDEMTEAVKNIANNKEQIEKIDSQTIKDYLWTRDLPPVDLVIRTGGEPHWSSGFMMWDTANSQFYFTETLLPDFSPEEFVSAIEKISAVERRMGK